MRQHVLSVNKCIQSKKGIVFNIEIMYSLGTGVEREDEVKFTDERVCKSYIMGLCPHELFNNTVRFYRICCKF